jgi:hypothetical protein
MGSVRVEGAQQVERFGLEAVLLSFFVPPNRRGRAFLKIQ